MEASFMPTHCIIEHVAMDVLDPLPKAKCGNQFTAVMIDRYSKLAKAIQTARTTTTAVITIFGHH